MASHDVFLSVESARAIIAAPQMHTTEGLRRSIEVLKTYGDWMDYERARMLERQLNAEALLPPRRDIVMTALDAIGLFGLLFAGFLIGAGLGWL